MARRTLTDKTIAALKVTKRTTIPDPKLAGHYVRVTPAERSHLSPSLVTRVGSKFGTQSLQRT
jgi:hypothetical protein